MASSYQMNIGVNSNPNNVYNFLASRQSIGEMKFQGAYPENFTLNFIVPSTWIKAGQVIIMVVCDDGRGGTVVQVLSRCLKTTQLFDGGKNQKNCQEIQQFLMSAFR